jgi:hypothetical protein
MNRDNVTNIEAHRLADVIMQEWIASFSDNGQIWESAVERTRKAKAKETEEIIEEAIAIAQARWKKMNNLD